LRAGIRRMDAVGELAGPHGEARAIVLGVEVQAAAGEEVARVVSAVAFAQASRVAVDLVGGHGAVGQVDVGATEVGVRRQSTRVEGGGELCRAVVLEAGPVIHVGIVKGAVEAVLATGVIARVSRRAYEAAIAPPQRCVCLYLT
jgi:hypothetical protein